MTAEAVNQMKPKIMVLLDTIKMCEERLRTV